MSEELDNVVLVRLREIREKLEIIDQRLINVEKQSVASDKRIEEQHTLLVYTLGQSTETGFKQTKQERRLDQVFDELEKLLRERQPS
jgi:uncharacterized protein YfkK (UPF0435 family)